MARSIGQRIRSRIGAALQLVPQDTGPVAWADAQAWEFDNAKQFMANPSFSKVLDDLNDPANSASTGYVNPLMLTEFFGSDHRVWLDFVASITGKVVAEIGPAVASPLALWDVASRRIAIEPLYSLIFPYQQAEFGRTGFKNVEAFSVPAERRIEELVGAINGALLVRNCIDHSPQWPFILSNIADYMAPGAQLLIWNDLKHPPEYRDGHYDITDDPAAFRRLIENLGFTIQSEYQYPDSPCVNYGCRALRNAMRP